MLRSYFKEQKILYINDRHEEKDIESEDKRKLYDKRILGLLGKDDMAVFGDMIDEVLLGYYRSLGLADINHEYIYYVPDYQNYKSLTEALSNNETLIDKIKSKKPDILIPYIESETVYIISHRLKCKLLNNHNITEWANDKIAYRRQLYRLDLSVITGFEVASFKEAEKAFCDLKRKGFKKALLKKPRSVAGFGIFTVESRKHLKSRLLENFIDGDSILIEGLVPRVVFSPNVQFWIDKNKIELIASTDQLFAKNSYTHDGNSFPSLLEKHPEIKEKIYGMCKKICFRFQEQGYYGVVGIDFIITAEGKIYSTEANARFNASTFSAMMVKKLFGDQKVFWKSFVLRTNPMSFEDIYESNKNVFISNKREYGIFPLSIDCLNTLGEAEFLAIDKSKERIDQLINNFNKQFYPSVIK
jgi:predicted ATP-grasp superfamily ATP-dependent carboligase